MNSCVFCDILRGKLASSVVYRDDLCWAFMDIRPVNPGHVLVIPIRHAASLAELHPETGTHMFRIAQRIAQALRESSIRCEGVNLFLADGAAAGQEVFHVHLHVVPRFEGDGFGFRRSPGSGAIRPRDELDDLAGKVRRALPGAQVL